MADSKKIALFIDADNIPAKYGKIIMETLQNRGEIFIRRVYGNWEKNSLHGWNECILNYGLLAVQQMDFTSGKNATDMSLTIDAMDVLYQRQAEIFAIVSDDSDFTPLAVKLRERGVYVVGLGKKNKASNSFRSACNEFIEMEVLEEDNAEKNTSENLKTELEPVKAAPVSKIISVPKSLPIPAEKKSPAKKKSPEKKMTLEQRFVWCGQNGLKNPKKKFQQVHDILHESARVHADSNGFAPLNYAGQDLKKKNLGFGIKNFGYSLLHEFIGDFPDLYELTRTKGGKSFRYKIKK
ncbi:MAG: NYN domain-containing protein [Selenomonadaceae bacterium]|nr:NYN domain-containing protein [Selenomonadaceae bacterium]